MPFFLTNLPDVKAASAGLGTASIGITVSLSNVQTLLGIFAAIVGIGLTIFTAYWRYTEHKERMKKPQSLEDNDEWDE